ncbi:MAG TPA: hypothetical protein VEC37_17080 [Bacillota bacterium]|nr:hypothetical protein [Bacillota bacterium]
MKKKHDCLKVFSLIMLILVFRTTVGAANKTVKLPAGYRDNLSKVLPANQEWQVEQYSPDSQMITGTKQTIVDSKPGEITEVSTSDLFLVTTHLDAGIHFKDSLVTLKNKELIKKAGFDQNVTRFDYLKKEVTVTQYLNNQQQKTQKMKYDSNLIDMEFLPLFLQCLLLKGITDFNADVLLGGKIYNADFVLTTTVQIREAASMYKYPEKFLAGLKSRGEVYLYVVGATGAVKLLYPHQFYYAFEKKPPHRIVATWGGDPKESEYVLYK